jgi:hypothetical protein
MTFCLHPELDDAVPAYGVDVDGGDGDVVRSR